MWLNSKDDRKLSLKQYGVLFHHFDNDYDVTDNYIMQNTYEEISKNIGEILKDLTPCYNEHCEDYGDR